MTKAAQAVDMSKKTAHLRILATTDIHMQLVGHDYVTDQAAANSGLAGIATLIKQARAEAHNENRRCILLDNGDMLQGTVMGNLLATRPVDATHPVAASINAMQYDAIGIGNHDLDYGLPYLFDVAAQLDMPVISTNLTIKGPNPVQRAALIDCALPGEPTAQKHILRVGILSVLPAKTAIWNRHTLDGHATVAPAANCLAEAAAKLREEGADVVVVLAHMGIGHNGSKEEDSALSLAHIPGIDAIISGHTHQRFPGLDHMGRAGVDADMGTLGQRPAIMPGYSGSDLAVLDLTLKKSKGTEWRVIGHVSKLRRNCAEVTEDQKIASLCAPAHQLTRAHLAVEVGHTDVTLQNYFSLAAPTMIASLTARAKARVVRDALQGTTDANLPLLAAVAAHTAGGRNGPDHYLAISKGPVLRRDIAGLGPYANQIWALRTTGDDLLRMLEHSATVFHRLRARQPTQNLIDPHVPSFNHDTVFGISYRIDPTRQTGKRIKSLQYRGNPILPHDQFILVTNQFRAAGGGGFPSAPCDAVALRSSVSLDAALIDALAHPEDKIWPSYTPWEFDCDIPVQAVLQTTPLALDHLQDLSHLSPEYCGTTADGFAKIRLTL